MVSLFLITELEPVGIHVLLSRPGFIKTRLVAEMKTVAALTVEVKFDHYSHLSKGLSDLKPK